MGKKERVEEIDLNKNIEKKKGKERELIEETLYEYRKGKLLTYKGEAVTNEKEALAVAMDRIKELKAKG